MQRAVSISVAVALFSAGIGVFVFLCFGSLWQARAVAPSGVFPTEYDAAYAGANFHTAPPKLVLRAQEPVAVLWDTYGKDYWACYVRTSNGTRGWVLCTSLSKFSGGVGA